MLPYQHRVAKLDVMFLDSLCFRCQEGIPKPILQLFHSEARPNGAEARTEMLWSFAVESLLSLSCTLLMTNNQLILSSFCF